MLPFNNALTERRILQNAGLYNNLRNSLTFGLCFAIQKGVLPSTPIIPVQTMHAIQLAKIANWAAFNANRLIAGPSPLSAADCNEYWSQSKIRQNRWMAALKLFEHDIRSETHAYDPWPALEIVIQEIFLSEMLTRVWAGTLINHDDHFQTNELSGIAHSIHIGHVEAKNRAMRLLLEDSQVSPDVFDRLNALRRKVERWTDLLLGQLPIVDVCLGFAFQPNRVKDFHQENSAHDSNRNRTRQLLFAASMSEDLRSYSNQYSANPEINRKIAGGLLICFPADRFDSHGLPKSLQLIWMEKTTEDTQLLMDDLTALDHTIISTTSDDAIERG